MELSEVVNPHYAFPVGLVLICAVLVFAFGFKSAEQPAFAQLTYTGDDRKPAGKKRKIKDKKSQHSANEVQSDVTKGSSKSDTEKDVSSKPAPKQDKPKKQEASPVKDQSKNVNKDTSKVVTAKPQKENKEAVKPLKEKKQETVEKSPPKDNNKIASKTKGKGNETKGEEIKNRKNEKNLAKLKAEEKPSDFDDGEWEQALSRKDKKNRKKDDPLLSDDAVESGKENKSPSKKKSNKKIDTNSVKLEITADEIKIVEDAVEKTPSEKQLQKDNKEEEKRKTKKPAKDAVIEDEKVLEESGNAGDGGSKSKKKNKKKMTTAAKPAEPEIVTIEAVEVPEEVVVKEKKQVELKEKENSPVIIETKNEPKKEPESNVVFDELGDVWKEAKTQKKSKKKVRKDQ